MNEYRIGPTRVVAKGSSMELPITYVDIGFIMHATEDENKVGKAVQQVLSGEYAESSSMERNELKGHYGNPIVLYQSRIRTKQAVKALIQNLVYNLSHSDKKMLHSQIELHVKTGSLYLRLDKQAAFQGRLKLGTMDPIRIRIRFNTKKIQDIVDSCREIGILE